VDISNAARIRVLVIEDNDVVRRALRGLIAHDEALEVVGEAASGNSALESIRTLQPDLLCLDIMLPGVDGLTILRQVRQDFPAMRVVLITGQATAAVVAQARELGARGFVVKPFNGDKILKTIHAALA
jgi:two-component system chemotaxis response regulator CheY